MQTRRRVARRVRDFEIIDIYPYGIAFSWDKDGEPTSSVLFERGGPIPSAKMLTFFRWVHPATCTHRQLRPCQLSSEPHRAALVDLL
jgi:hypothetical protein